MTRAGIKQARISEITGISKGYLSELLSGKKPGPSPEAGKKLAEVLGVSPEWLVLGIEENATSVSHLNNLPPGQPVNYESSVVREDETPYRFTPMAKQCQGHEEEEGLRPVLERIANALEKLVEMEERRGP